MELQGKGFPDLATRSFLNIIHSVRPHMPMYALVDYDPDGMSILRTYQLGSSALIHEDHTTVPELRWLGIRSDQIMPSTQTTESPQSSQESGSSGTSQTLSTQDSFTGSAAGSSVGDLFDRQLSQPRRKSRSRHSRTAQLEALSALTLRDRKMARDMLQAVFQEQALVGGDSGMEQMHELQTMLMLNVKAEIQAVDNLGDITHWLDERLCNATVA